MSDDLSSDMPIATKLRNWSSWAVHDWRTPDAQNMVWGQSLAREAVIYIEKLEAWARATGHDDYCHTTYDPKDECTCGFAALGV